MGCIACVVLLLCALVYVYTYTSLLNFTSYHFELYIGPRRAGNGSRG